MNVFIDGIGGLGNTLYQLALGIYYAETHGYNIRIVRNNTTLFGTSQYFDRDKCIRDEDGNPVGYDKTIFRKLTFTDEVDSPYYHVLFNDYTSNKHEPNIDILIKGYNQNLNLFQSVLSSIPKYLHFGNKDYITTKYGDLSNATCICIRVGRDYSHMTKINQYSYIHALETTNIDTSKIVIISDVPNYWKDTRYSVIDANEPDIIQFELALMCKNFIMSESSFHSWIGYIATSLDPSKQVFYFKDTCIDERRLYLPSWKPIEYSELVTLIDNTRTDKNTSHSYIDVYETLMRPRRYSAKQVLEIGIGPADILNGGSIQLWHDYFPHAEISAIDIISYDDVWDKLKNNPRIKLYTSTDGYQRSFVDTLGEIDIVIDDGPHTLESMKQCIELYTNKLSKDGMIIIEDIPSLDWIEELIKVTPVALRNYIQVYDLRYKKRRGDDILFVIDKLLAN
jgi:hypothetical protein